MEEKQKDKIGDKITNEPREGQNGNKATKKAMRTSGRRSKGAA